MSEHWLEQLAQQNAAAIRQFLSRFSANPADIDDWFQEALLRLFAAARTGSIQQPRAYLFRTARNVALSRIAHRKVKRCAKYDIEQLQLNRGSTRSLPSAVDHDRSRAELLEAIALLPERCREVFIMCKFDGFSHKEIAEILGISVSTVEKHLVKGLRLCRAHLLQDRDGGEQMEHRRARR